MLNPPKLGLLRIAVAGMKSIGASHARALRELADAGWPVEVVAFSGGSPDQGAQTGWPNARQLSHSQILEDPSFDALALCSPSHLHGEQAIAVAKSGRHVVVEKPLALQVAQARELVALQRPDLVVAMISQRRHEGIYAAVKQMLDAGQLGRLRLLETTVHWYRDEDYFAAAPWRASTEHGGGSLVNQGAHSLDLFQWVGGQVTTVTAQVAALSGLVDFDDTVVATAQFAHGGLGMISTSTATPPGFEPTFSIFTDTGRIVLSGPKVVEWSVPAPQPVAQAQPGSGANDPLAIGTIGHQRAWAEIVTAIAQQRPPLVDAREGFKVTALIDAIYTAARTGQRVNVPAPE